MGKMQRGTNSVSKMAFSPDGHRLAVVSDTNIVLWNTDEGKAIAEFVAVSRDVEHVGFSSNGATLTIGYNDGEAELWDIGPRRVRARLLGHENSVLDMAVSHNSTLAATGSFDHTAKLWSLVSEDGAKEIATLKGHLTPVWSVAFSRDDNQLAVGLGGGEIGIWNIETRQEVATLRGHKLPVLAMRFLADGNNLVSVSADSIHLWDAIPLAEGDSPFKEVSSH
jgi:WD40 repeat protein